MKQGTIIKLSHDNNITQKLYVRHVDFVQHEFGCHGEKFYEIHPDCIDEENNLIHGFKFGDYVNFDLYKVSKPIPKLYAKLIDPKFKTENESWEDLLDDFIDDSLAEGKPFMLPIELEEWLKNNYPNGVKIKNK